MQLILTVPEGVSILMTDEGRLEIAADVDLAGLKTLRTMLDLYEPILALHPANSVSPSLPESPEA